eukprot:5704986-Alexandrium_andersonii.AAC.1
MGGPRGRSIGDAGLDAHDQGGAHSVRFPEKRLATPGRQLGGADRAMGPPLPARRRPHPPPGPA